MNQILKLLILSDIFVVSGLGLIAPIFAIFINDNLVGGSIIAAGLASTIFLVTKSILQIVFTKIFNPKDRFWMLILGTIMIMIVPFLYILANHINYIYLAQFIYGVGAGFAHPSWSSLFTANLERGKRGFQWSVYSSSVSMGTAITAYLGAIVAEYFGFKMVFVIAGVLSIIGLLILFELQKKQIMKKI